VEPPRVGRWRRRERYRRRAFIAFVTLTLCVVLACALSHLVTWSVFVASPNRPRRVMNRVALSAADVERDETHFMFGRGCLIVHSMNPYSASFDTRWSDAASRHLAWSSVRSWPHEAPASFKWFGGTPRGHVRLIPMAGACAIVSAAWLVCRLRRPHIGRCVKCKYDLSAGGDRIDLAGRCPECGAAQPCHVCGYALAGVAGSTPCPECGWDRSAEPALLQLGHGSG
jgi:hypothetical protein